MPQVCSWFGVHLWLYRPAPCARSPVKQWENRLTLLFGGKKHKSKYGLIQFLSGNLRTWFWDVSRFGYRGLQVDWCVSGIYGRSASFPDISGCVTQQSSAARWLRFGTAAPGCVFAWVCVWDEVCCGAARWRAHKSQCVGRHRTSSEAEGEKRRGHG